jgi:VWFA-related protein
VYSSAQMRWVIFSVAFGVCFSTLVPPVISAAQSAQATGSQSGTAPQLIPRSQEQRDRSYHDVHRISLFVQVSSSTGESIGSLEQKDFTLLVDGKPHDVAQFHSVQRDADTKPATVILVLDEVNSSSEKLRHYRQGIEEFLKSGQGPLDQQTSIATVSATGASISPPSSDRSALLTELHAQQAAKGVNDCDSTGSNERSLPRGKFTPSFSPVDPNVLLDCLDHRFSASITAMNSLASRKAKQSGRSILIWMGEGWPLLSGGNYKPDTPAIKATFYRNLVTISNGLREQHATLNAVASPDAEALSAHDKAFFDGVPSEKEVTAASLGLHALAHQSGGQVLKKTGGKDIAGEIRACIADTSSYYVLEFDTPPATAAGEYHSVKVEVGKSDLHVRTGTLYYAEQ